MDELWWKLLEQVLLVVLPVLAAAATAWIAQKVREGAARLTEHQRKVLLAVVQTAVLAAEQAGAAGYVKDKKAYALEVAQGWLKQQGVKIDLGLLDAAIEAAVLEEFNRYRSDGDSLGVRRDS